MENLSSDHSDIGDGVDELVTTLFRGITCTNPRPTCQQHANLEFIVLLRHQVANGYLASCSCMEPIGAVDEELQS